MLTAEEIPCANCDQPIAELAYPYLFCSVRCRQEAEYVRYARRVRTDGRAERPDVQEALHIRLAHLLAGGYSERQRRLAPAVRAATLARDAYACRRCGAPASEIDHVGEPIDGDMNHA